MNIHDWDDSTALGRAINRVLRADTKPVTEHQRAFMKAQPKSEGEEEFHFQITKISEVIPPADREVRLIEGRKWRFDFVWFPQKIVVEIEGGVYTQGRHTRGKGFTEDIRKYRAAENLGYRVLRFTTNMVKSGEALLVLERVFAPLI